MEPDDLVCLCHKVSLRKIVNFMERERPGVPSQLSECLGAGTSCQWCVPSLTALHRQWAGGTCPTLDQEAAAYAAQRQEYKAARAAAKARAAASEEAASTPSEQPPVGTGRAPEASAAGGATDVPSASPVTPSSPNGES